MPGPLAYFTMDLENLPAFHPVALLRNVYLWQQLSWPECLTDCLYTFHQFVDATAYMIYRYFIFMISVLRISLKMCFAIIPYTTPVFKAVVAEWKELPIWHQAFLLSFAVLSYTAYRVMNSERCDYVKQKIHQRVKILRHLTIQTSLVIAIFAVYGLLKVTFSSAVVAVLVHWSCVLTLFYTTWRAINDYNKTSWINRPKSIEEADDRYDLSMRIFGLLETWVILSTFDLVYNGMIRLVGMFVFWNKFEFSKRSIYSVVKLSSPVEDVIRRKAMEAAAESVYHGGASFFSIGSWALCPYQLVSFFEEAFGAIHDLFCIMLLVAYFAEMEIFHSKLRALIVTAYDRFLTLALGLQMKFLGDRMIDSPRRHVAEGDRRGLKRKTQWRRLIETSAAVSLEPRDHIELPPIITRLIDLWTMVYSYVLPVSYQESLRNIYVIAKSWLTYAPFVVSIVLPSFMIRLIHPFATVVLPAFKALQALNRWDLPCTDFWLTQLFACQASELVFAIILTFNPNVWFKTRMRLVLSGVFAVVLRDPARHMTATLDTANIILDGFNQALSSPNELPITDQSPAKIKNEEDTPCSSSPKTSPRSYVDSDGSSSKGNCKSSDWLEREQRVTSFIEEIRRNTTVSRSLERNLENDNNTDTKSIKEATSLFLPRQLTVLSNTEQQQENPTSPSVKKYDSDDNTVDTINLVTRGSTIVTPASPIGTVDDANATLVADDKSDSSTNSSTDADNVPMVENNPKENDEEATGESPETMQKSQEIDNNNCARCEVRTRNVIESEAEAEPKDNISETSNEHDVFFDGSSTTTESRSMDNDPKLIRTTPNIDSGNNGMKERMTTLRQSTAMTLQKLDELLKRTTTT